MKRRFFLALLTTGAIAAIAEPAQAFGRRGRRRRFRGERRWQRWASRQTTSRPVQTASYSRAPSYSNVSYTRPSSAQVSQRPKARPQPQPEMSQRRTPGHIEREEVATFRLKGQSRKSMAQKYGQPMAVDGNQDIWHVTKTSDGIRAAGRFVVTYTADGKAVSAYTFGY